MLQIEDMNIAWCIAEAKAQEKDQLHPEFSRFMAATALHLETMQKNVAALRAALVGLVGADDEDALRQMEAALRLLPAPDSDKTVTINAIHALLATGGQ